MKKLFFEDKQAGEGPQLHALIIGIDHYPHLGLAGAIERELPLLSNLSSPTVSARALARWLVGHQEWLSDMKLGSVDLVVAPVPADGAAVASGPGSLPVIMTAFNNWFGRCNTNVDNVALFYFCGHGLQKDALLLLPEDFGEQKYNPWTQMIDFHATYRGMANCAAKTQYFIVDACREWSEEFVLDLNVRGVALGRSDLRKQGARLAPALYGAAPGLAALSLKAGTVSRLTRAVIDCLGGKAAVRLNGRWHVNVEKLGQAAKEIVEYGNRSLPSVEHHQTVDPTIGEFSGQKRTLLVLPDGVHPSTLVEFTCNPGEATKHAKFYHQGIFPKARRRRTIAPREGPWSVEVLAGTYDFGATIERPGFANGKLPHESAQPPISYGRRAGLVRATGC